jgi:hypothetical protein
MRVSSNLMTDINGAAYVLHNAVVGAVGDFSPGTRANETPF